MKKFVVMKTMWLPAIEFAGMVYPQIPKTTMDSIWPDKVGADRCVFVKTMEAGLDTIYKVEERNS